MVFDRHLFISYAHLDNKPITREQEGWVSRFHASLEAMLSMRIGRKAEIWRDQKLSGNDLFADEILAQFPKTAMLVSVLTPRYLESDWCVREMREFCKVAGKSGGVALENKSRIIKVIKTPVKNEGQLPELVQGMEGYQFYTFVDDAPVELDPVYGPELAQKYNLKLAKLAWDVKELLERMESRDPAQAPPHARAQTTIYLAHCAYDRRESRDAIEAELRLHGYQVVPQGPLPTEESAYAAEVSRLLGQSALSIHLVGGAYGSVLDGPSGKSVVVLQNELAVERSKSAGLRRLIWLPKGTESEHTAQKAFITAMHEDTEVQFGADLITDDVEGFKRAIHGVLEKPEMRKRAHSEKRTAAGTKRLYLMCVKEDRSAILPLRKYLRGQGFEVETPVFEGDARTVRDANETLLKECQGILLYYGAGSEAWKRLARPKSTRKPVCTYLALPATEDKQDLVDADEPHLLDGLGEFPETALQHFLEGL